VARPPEKCGEILGLATVFGREFSLPSLERVSEIPAGELLDHSHESIAADLVAEISGTPRPAAVHSRTDPRRHLSAHPCRAAPSAAPAHRRSAGGVLPPRPGPHLAELTHYVCQAAPGDAAKAVSYAERTGQRAIALLAYEEASPAA
jgi:hypothetical protein